MQDALYLKAPHYANLCWLVDCVLQQRNPRCTAAKSVAVFQGLNWAHIGRAGANEAELELSQLPALRIERIVKAPLGERVALYPNLGATLRALRLIEILAPSTQQLNKEYPSC